MKIDSIKEGIVIDHISAGGAMQLYDLLNLDALDCSVAVIKNVQSRKMGKKDIIKIDSNIDINLDAVGYISPHATIDIIRDGVLCEKRTAELPERLTDIIKCKNPRCITTTEQEIKHIFRLCDKENEIYRCIYCDTKFTK